MLIDLSFSFVYPPSFLAHRTGSCRVRFDRVVVVRCLGHLQAWNDPPTCSFSFNLLCPFGRFLQRWLRRPMKSCHLDCMNIFPLSYSRVGKKKTHHLPGGSYVPDISYQDMRPRHPRRITTIFFISNIAWYYYGNQLIVKGESMFFYECSWSCCNGADRQNMLTHRKLLL